MCQQSSEINFPIIPWQIIRGKAFGASWGFNGARGKPDLFHCPLVAPQHGCSRMKRGACFALCVQHKTSRFVSFQSPEVICPRSCKLNYPAAVCRWWQEGIDSVLWIFCYGRGRCALNCISVIYQGNSGGTRVCVGPQLYTIYTAYKSRHHFLGIVSCCWCSVKSWIHHTAQPKKGLANISWGWPFIFEWKPSSGPAGAELCAREGSRALVALCRELAGCLQPRWQPWRSGVLSPVLSELFTVVMLGAWHWAETAEINGS